MKDHIEKATTNAVEAAGSSFATKATYTGSATVLLGGFTANDIAMIGGVVLAILGYITNLYFQFRREQREVALHTAQMKAYDPNDPTTDRRVRAKNEEEAGL